MKGESARAVFKACPLTSPFCALRNSAKEWVDCQELIGNLFNIDSTACGPQLCCAPYGSNPLEEESLGAQIPTINEEPFAKSAREGLDIISGELKGLLKSASRSSSSQYEANRISIPPIELKERELLYSDKAESDEEEPFATEMRIAATDFAQKRLGSVIVRLRQLIGRCNAESSRVPALYHALGIALMESGELNQARNQLLTALSLARGSPTEPLTSDILDDLGMVYLYQGKIDASTRVHRRALRGNILRGDQRRVARSCEHMGLAAWKRGDAAVAVGWLLVSLSLRCPLGFAGELADSVDSLGRICSSMKFHSVALALHCRALNHRFTVGDEPATAKTWTNLGVALRRLKQLPLALYCHRQAMRIRRRCQDRVGMANSYNNLGLVLMKMGRLRSARKQLRKALWLRCEMSDSLNVTRNLVNLRSIETAWRMKAESVN